MKNNYSEEERLSFLVKAQHLLGEGRSEEAFRLAGDQLKRYPADAAALDICCEALIVMGRLHQMHGVLDDMADSIARLNLVYEHAGDACREKGFHQEAASCYEKFLSLRPDAEKAAEIIEKMALLEQKDSPVSEAVPEETKSFQQDFFTVTMAKLYIEQGHRQDAEIILEEIISKEPQNEQALRMLEDLRACVPSGERAQAETSKTGRLINVLSSWLKNIERSRMNAAKG